MKKLKTLLTLAMVALMSLSFTSCDEDANTAYYLDGTWRGNMYVNSSYHGVTYIPPIPLSLSMPDTTLVMAIG